MVNKTNTFAILSLIFAFFFFPLGLIFGIIALSQIKRSKEEGKGLAIAGIVVSCLPLVMLILVVIFMSKSANFEQTVGKQSQTELIKMQIQYGQCRPGAEAENIFKVDYSKATTYLKEQVQSIFKQEINRCGSLTSEINCNSANCVWD